MGSTARNRGATPGILVVMTPHTSGRTTPSTPATRAHVSERDVQLAFMLAVGLLRSHERRGLLATPTGEHPEELDCSLEASTPDRPDHTGDGCAEGGDR